MPVHPVPTSHQYLLKYFRCEVQSWGVLSLMEKSCEEYLTDQIQTSSWSFELVFSKQSILFWRSATVQLQQGREMNKNNK